jgi:type IX secretion system PorP/SprF family membrane protein
MKINLLKHRLLAVVSLLVITFSVQSQDIHFSQYYASPLTLNPALTGKFNGEYRIGGIYRSQWAPAGSPLFMTPSLHVDFSLFKGKLKKDAVGVGLMFFTDRQNKATLVTTQIMLSLAYHKGLGRNNGTQISLGFQGGYVMKRLNALNLTFADGYTIGGGGFAYNTSAELAALKPGVNYVNMNAGLFVNSRVRKNIVIYGGYSLNNLGTPTERFSSNGINNVDIDMRHVIHVGAEWDAAERFVVIPGILWQTQAKSAELNFGVTAGYHVRLDPEANGRDHTTLFVGLWNRMTPNYVSRNKSKYGEESIIPKLGFEIKRIRFGAALDIPLSKIIQRIGLLKLWLY